MTGEDVDSLNHILTAQYLGGRTTLQGSIGCAFDYKTPCGK